MSTMTRWTLAEYDRMVASGVFEPDRRIEFIQGEIREMPPIGPSHEDLVDKLMVWGVRRLPEDRLRVRVQNSIGLPQLQSAPQPDIAWVKQRDYSRRRPTGADVLLVVEVSDSRLDYDCGEKADLYAAAGIADYWAIDVPGRAAIVHRDPQGGKYRDVRRYSGDEELRPLAFPEVALRLASLWED